MYFEYVPKAEAAHPTVDAMVPQTKNKMFDKFMRQNGDRVTEAIDMTYDFLTHLYIPGHEIKINKAKLSSMMERYIFTRS